MDTLFHFSTEITAKNKGSSPNQQFFSDVEGDEHPSSNLTFVKKSTFASNFKQEGSSDTDETPIEGYISNLKVTSKFSSGKTSKFRNLTTKQPSGDEGLQDAEEPKDELPAPFDGQKLKEKKASIMLEGAKKEIISTTTTATTISLKNVKELKARNLQTQARKMESDADVKKVVAKNQILDNLKNHPFRHLIFSNYIQEVSFKKHLSLTYRGLVYASKCLKGPSDKYIKSKQVEVSRPKNSKGKTLLLDLDETLIHSCSVRENPDHVIQATSDGGEFSQIGLKIRPFCLEFLQLLTQYWDIYIFTASSPNYAEAIVNYIDPNKKYINGILNRNNCMETKNGFFIKDLRIVSGSDLKSTILVDNLSHSFGFQPYNGVPIIEWHNDREDQELKHLVDYLIQAAQSPDVREFNKQYLKLHELIEMKIEDLGI